MLVSRRFQLTMLMGELLLLLIAAVDEVLRATKVLRLSADRPRRPTAEQFAKQQQRQQQQRSRTIATTNASTSSLTTTRTTPTTATKTAAPATNANNTAAPLSSSSSPPPTPERRLDAVVIGGGAAGVSTAAALSRAGLSSVVVLEKNSSPGEVWRKRYSSLTLHDIADDCALPFVKIPDSLPVYLPAGVFADYLDFHARIHRIDFRGGVEATAVEPLRGSSSSDASSSFSSGSSGGDRWRVRTRAVSDGEEGEPSTSSSYCLETENVVFCDGGLYNKPKIPPFAREAMEAKANGTKSEFLGEVLHSSQLNAREGSCARFAGKRVLVVGFGNSAMDVVQELVAVLAKAVVVAVRDPSRRAVVPLLAYGAYQEQLARYSFLSWADKAATYLESKSVASKRVLKSVESGGGGGGGGASGSNGGNGGDEDDSDEGNSSTSFNAAFSPLFLFLAALASALAPLFRSLATAIDQLLDAATAARSLRAWAALGARGGDLSPYGLSTLPGGKGDCGPVTWTKRTANVLVMDTGAVKEVIRGNARVVVAAVEKLGPGKRVELRPTGAVAAVGVSETEKRRAAAATARSSQEQEQEQQAQQEAEEEEEEQVLPSSASPSTMALLKAAGGVVPGGEAPVLAPAPRFLEDIDAVILCTGFDTMQQCYSLISDDDARNKLGGGGAAGYLVPPDQRGSGAVECGKPVPGLEGLYFVYGRLTQVRDGALEVAGRIAEARRRRRGRRGNGAVKQE